ncbi:MAG: hypothetical protein A3A82_01720 [Candidatus Pacebacteria bacterium RIFCSPLOWO2_01_FULL_47_12]|nr:MAG: hypothetical protein A3J60_04200 [Candidatus Pacebacteria bacterium RIFCSPHIGHO2_02_FULL_46_9]OGJ39408.1 MAG: hypothetical protein A3A82_01720 [Candidatus Pacebacteria bacterium RIFCSPLOWO2_01_FULL_47_12]
MRNWSVNTQKLDKNAQNATKWRYEQSINFGLEGERLERVTVRRLLATLQIDPDKKKLLEFILQHVPAD